MQALVPDCPPVRVPVFPGCQSLLPDSMCDPLPRVAASSTAYIRLSSVPTSPRALGGRSLVVPEFRSGGRVWFAFHDMRFSLMARHPLSSSQKASKTQRPIQLDFYTRQLLAL